jgi:hypothetical protein
MAYLEISTSYGCRHGIIPPHKALFCGARHYNTQT